MNMRANEPINPMFGYPLLHSALDIYKNLMFNGAAILSLFFQCFKNCFFFVNFVNNLSFIHQFKLEGYIDQFVRISLHLPESL